MSPYELADLFNSQAAFLLAILMGFVSTTSAFLAVTYLAGKEFTSFIRIMTLMLYSITSILLMALAQRQSAVLVGLRSQMEGVLTWHPAVYEANWIMPTAFYSTVFVMAALFISSIWYFLYTSKTDEKNT
jgi:hypothetical protein